MSQLELLIPRSGLLAWYAADAIVGVAGGGNVSSVPDKSGNGKTLTCSSSHPTLSLNSINSLPAINWSGSQNPLNYASAGGVAKRIYIVASYADATFAADPNYPGLLSDSATIVILLGNASTTKWYDHGFGANYTYKRRDRAFAENDQQATMSGAFSIYELTYTTGWSFNGIQLGQDRNLTARKWKGKFAEMLMFDRVPTDAENNDIYEYLALRYQLWRQNASGVNVFPFSPDWQRPLVVSKPVLSSVSVSQARKSRSKGTKKKGFEPKFESRWAEEYDAAVAFWNEHYPGTTFIYRDQAFSPERDTTVEFLTDLASQSDGYHDINYGFQAVEV